MGIGWIRWHAYGKEQVIKYLHYQKCTFFIFFFTVSSPPVLSTWRKQESFLVKQNALSNFATKSTILSWKLYKKQKGVRYKPFIVVIQSQFCIAGVWLENI